MQLPRGTFREIRKNITIESLIHALDGDKFTGVVNISSPSVTGTLVFRSGECILVKIGDVRGDAGMEEVIRAGKKEVDAAISILDDAQIELALEFNKPFRILRSGKRTPPPVPQRPVQPSREPARPSRAAAPEAPGSLQKPPVQPAAPPARAPASHPPGRPSLFSRTAGSPASPANPASPASPARAGGAPAVPRQAEEEEKTAEKDRDTASFEKDLDTFDSMDIDTVTDKIRTDCKTMIKQLHLDHLMER